MVDENCRLCFAKNDDIIGIFTAKGIELKLASIIRLHLPDEVSQDDILPKFVCSACWTKLENFHEFYNAVDKAKDIYLRNSMKVEFPNFVEVNCDEGDEGDDEVRSVKVEPIVDVVVIKLEPPPSEENTIENDTKEHVMECNNDHFDQTDISTGLELVTVPSAQPKAEVKTILPRSKRRKTTSRKFDHLIANYIDMKCELCEYPFGTLMDARGHLRSVHKLRSIKMKCCQKKVDLYDVNGHIQYHLDPEIHTCDKCNKSFFLKSELRNHRKTHLPKTKRFECKMCEKSFSKLFSLTYHISSSHTKKKPFECEICKKSFFMKTTLIRHVRGVHERQNQQVCHICAKVYQSTRALQEHLKEHSDVPGPRINCQICGFSLKNEISLRAHMTSHAGTTFPCPECEKILTNRVALANHIKIHGSKLHKCEVCGHEFTRAESLRKHMPTHMGKPYECAYCPKAFKSKLNLSRHRRAHHPVEWAADRMAATAPKKKRKTATEKISKNE